MSLRARLMLAVAAVVLASIGAVALISSRVVRVEFDQLMRKSAPSYVDTSAAEKRLLAHYRARKWTDVSAVLVALRAESFREHDLMLLDDGDRLIASTAPVQNVRVTRGPRGTTVDFRRGGDMARLIFAGDQIVVRDGDRAIATLYPTPRMRERRGGNMAAAIRNVNRGLLAIVAAVGVLALLSTALIARRIVRPIEQLQHAASRIASGDLGVRVPVDSRDEVGRLGHAFNAMSEQLARDEVLRRNLVNDVAHELRTPLTNLLCTVEAVQDGLRTADAKTFESLHDDLELLQRLVDDLQTLALAEAGKLPLHVERVELSEIVDVPAGLFVDVDRVRFQQIIANLTSNARVHGGGNVSISARERDGEIELQISDDGPGIAPEHLPHIFDRFYRADPSRARTTGGAGLGLAIVKNLVELHGGRIDASSSAGSGTTFTIRLPRSVSPSASPARPASAPDSPRS
jgi:signal transduction histidine kinase